MFMVTAMGTAVRARRKSPDDAQEAEAIRVISGEEIEAITRTRRLVANLSEGNDLAFDDSTWEFVTRNRVHEVADYVLKLVGQPPKANASDYSRKQHSEVSANATAYLLSLPRDRAMEASLHALRDGTCGDEFIYSLIDEVGQLDLWPVLEFLRSEDLDIRKKAVQLLVCSKEAFVPEDVALLGEVTSAIEEAFPSIVKQTSERGRLSGQKKPRWLCGCGEKRDRASGYCHSCQRDQQGFTKDELKPQEGIDRANEIRSILRDRFGFNDTVPAR